MLWLNPESILICGPPSPLRLSPSGSCRASAASTLGSATGPRGPRRAVPSRKSFPTARTAPGRPSRGTRPPRGPAGGPASRRAGYRRPAQPPRRSRSGRAAPQVFPDRPFSTGNACTEDQRVGGILQERSEVFPITARVIALSVHPSSASETSSGHGIDRTLADGTESRSASSYAPERTVRASR